LVRVREPKVSKDDIYDGHGAKALNIKKTASASSGLWRIATLLHNVRPEWFLKRRKLAQEVGGLTEFHPRGQANHPTSARNPSEFAGRAPALGTDRRDGNAV
jgi:hypothetical protein